MQVTTTGKQIDAGDALRRHADGRMQELVTGYFDHAPGASTAFAREGKGRQGRSHISVHAGRGTVMPGHDVPAPAFRNSARGGANGICRRRDRNVGWTGPSGNPKRI